MEIKQNQELSQDDLMSMLDFNFETEEQSNTQTEVDGIDISFEKQEVEQEQEKDVQQEEEVSNEVVIETTTEPTPTVYDTLLKDRLESEEWSDAEIEVNGEKIAISELKSIDEETYNFIKEAQKNLKKEEIESKYIKVDGLSEQQKSLINIVKTGDLEKAKELFENPQILQEPFKGFDNDNEEHNIQVLAWKYSSQGKTPKQIQALIQIAKEDLTLDVEAKQIVEEEQKNYFNHLKETENRLLQEKTAEQEKIKTYRKELINEFKESGLEEGLSKRFADVASKYTQEGNFEIDNILDDILKDPKKASRLIHFVLDEKGFIAKATSEVKKNEQIKSLKFIGALKDTTNKAVKKDDESNDTAFEVYV